MTACTVKIPTNKIFLECHLRQIEFILTLVVRMQFAKHSSTLHLEAPQLCNNNYLFVSSFINAILKDREKSGSSKNGLCSFHNFFPYNFIQRPHFILMLQTCVQNSNVADVILISPNILKGLAISSPTTLEQTVVMLLFHEGVCICPPFISNFAPAYQHHIRLVCIEPQPVGS